MSVGIIVICLRNYFIVYAIIVTSLAIIVTPKFFIVTTVASIVTAWANILAVVGCY